MDLAKDFVFQPLPPNTQSDAEVAPLAFASTTASVAAAAEPVNFGRLADLRGKWEGTGFNTIWRPLFNPGQEDFLELNLTDETMEFEEIQGAIPNRGFKQKDINMYGLHYLQQISDKNLGTGLHFEPGIWAHVPATTHPSLGVTIVRMATVPHGTAFVAQGTSSSADESVKPDIPKTDIFPTSPGDSPDDPKPKLSDIPEMDLKSNSKFRTSGAGLTGITQAMILDPNSVLRDAIAHQNITSTTRLQVTTSQKTLGSGGVANTAFLNGGASGDENATAAKVTSTFWLERLDGEKVASQLQYSQRVLLTFNGVSWPHFTVATLRRVS